jgi:hypothetical protein
MSISADFDCNEAKAGGTPVPMISFDDGVSLRFYVTQTSLAALQLFQQDSNRRLIVSRAGSHKKNENMNLDIGSHDLSPPVSVEARTIVLSMNWLERQEQPREAFVVDKCDIQNCTHHSIRVEWFAAVRFQMDRKPCLNRVWFPHRPSFLDRTSVL